MNKFDKIFEEFNERMFFESATAHSNLNSKLIEFTKDNLNDFFKNAYIIKDNNFKNILTDEYILLETAEEVNFNQPVLDMFLNAKYGEKIPAEKILNKINKNWKYYKSFKENINECLPIYVFQFNFDDDKSKLHMMHYLFPFTRKYKNDEILNNLNKITDEKTFGFLSYVPNKAAFMCLRQPASKNTVAHELCHYFQNVIKILINDNNNEISTDIGNLFMTKDELNGLLNSNEFYPHILVDLFADLKTFHHKSKFKNLSKDEFLQITFNFVEKYKDEIFRTEYGREWLLYMKDDTSLMILAATCFLNYKYDFIKNKLLSDF